MGRSTIQPTLAPHRRQPAPVPAAGGTIGRAGAGAATDPVPPRRRSRRVTTLVTFLAVLLAAEGGARLLDQRVDDGGGWHLGLVGANVEAMEAVAAREGAVDVLLLGSSSMGAGVDPAELGQQLGGASAFTAWLPGPDTHGLRRYASALAAPTLDPGVVVIGLTSRELNDRGRTQEHQHRAMTSSPAWVQRTGEGTQLQRLELALARHSAFVRLRSQLRRPNQRLVDGLRGQIAAPPVDARGMLTDRLGQPLVLDAAHLAQEREALLGFSVGGRATDELARLVAELRQDGRQVVLVDLPVLTDEWVPLHPSGAADHEAYRAELAAVADRLGVPLIDAARRQDWDPGAFGDVNHLNRSGAERLTQLLADELEALGLR